jgi:hypothetical protein
LAGVARFLKWSIAKMDNSLGTHVFCPTSTSKSKGGKFWGLKTHHSAWKPGVSGILVPDSAAESYTKEESCMNEEKSNKGEL